MTITNFNYGPIFDDLEATLAAALVPGQFASVSQILRVTELSQIRQVIDQEDVPALFIIDPPVDQITGPRSSLGFVACYREHITDLQIALLGVTALDLTTQTPHTDIFDPKCEAIAEAVLADRTRGGLALTTAVQSSSHTGMTQGSRFYFGINLLCPFEWQSP